MVRCLSRRRALRLAVAACAALPAAALLGGCDAQNEPVMKYLSVSLPAHAGTGYSWTCTLEPAKVLELTGSEVIDEAQGGAVNGGPTSHVFTFEAKGEGVSVVAFELTRPWEEETEPAEWVTYRFSVDASLNVTEDSHEGTVDPGVVYWS